MALTQASLLPISNIATSGGTNNTPVGEYGLHPEAGDFALTGTPTGGTAQTQNFAGLASQFESSRLAFVANMGTLVRPLTKPTYLNNSVPRPQQLFSHNDQETQWNLSRGRSDFKYGWGGLVADRIRQLNNEQRLSSCISLGGGNRFQVGADVFPYQMSSGGTLSLAGYNTNPPPAATSSLEGARRAALDALLVRTTGNPLVDEQGKILKRAMELDVLIRGWLGNASSNLNTLFPSDAGVVAGQGQDTGNSLASQLKMVARMIKGRTQLGQARQIFYVRLGGFDTHSTQMTSQPVLVRRINRALASFQAALVELGIQDSVTTFSMSEFGRTLNSNGDGSDHAWGSNQFVLGSKVQGKRIYGTFPSVTLDGPDSLSRGQMIPSTSVDQFGATLAQWMGMGGGDLATIFPNLANFTFPANGMGFMLP